VQAAKRKRNQYYDDRQLGGNSQKSQRRTGRRAGSTLVDWANIVQEEVLAPLMTYVMPASGVYAAAQYNPFTNPISKRDVPDYAMYVRNPMSLSIIIDNLKGGQYDGRASLESALMLVLTNTKVSGAAVLTSLLVLRRPPC